TAVAASLEEPRIRLLTASSNPSCTSKSTKKRPTSLAPCFSARTCGSNRRPRASSSESRASTKFVRARVVVVLIQDGPPSQPATLGGANRVWPIRAQDEASAVAETVGWRISKARIVPTVNSTGDLTRRRRTDGSKKRFERKIISTGTLISYPDLR